MGITITYDKKTKKIKGFEILNKDIVKSTSNQEEKLKGKEDITQ